MSHVSKLKANGIAFRVSGGCWECTSHKPNSSGYPCRHGSLMNRFVYRLLVGPIPNGMYVLHTCDNRICINPGHLWTGTHADNQNDKIKKGRQSRLSGTKNGRAKLTEDQVRRIILDDRKIKEIAVDYGMSFQMVSRIKRREAWNAVC